MKLAMLALSIMFAGCSPFGFNPMGYDSPELDLDSAWKQTAVYQYQDEPGQYWKSPYEFERDGGGDCEDFAGYILYLLGEGDMVIVQKLDRDTLHALIKYRGQIIEPQTYRNYPDISQYKIVGVYNYNTTMHYITNGGMKMIAGSKEP